MDFIQFSVNGKIYKVGSEVSSTVMLVDYLRDTLGLHGTKYMCREGGCGACVVAVTKCQGGPVQAVNACLMPITSCHGWEITTIEHLGNRKIGYNVIQERLAEKSGSQCGYCSPAWVMNLYSFLQKEIKPSKIELEQSFGSNVCRCTGYRPILDAFKSFSKEEQLNGAILDIEDLKICKKSGSVCTKICEDEDDWCILSADDVKKDNFIKINLHDGRYWYKVNNLFEVLQILQTVYNKFYMLVFGNSAKGVYPVLDYPTTLIDISTVPELKYHSLDQNLVVGVGHTITEFQDLLASTAATNQNFAYLNKLVEHINLIAHIPVRNQGSVGGNLMIKHQHNDFPSDIFLLLETVGAFVNVLSPDRQYTKCSMQSFLKLDMTGKILVHVLLPPLCDKHKVVTFKIMPRFQNAHAIVNSGFRYELTDDNKVKEARIVYGGLSPTFIRAPATEKYLIGKPLFDNSVLQSALGVLSNELVVEENPPEASAEFRRKLAVALFYKGLLSLCPTSLLQVKYKTGALKIHSTRPVSNGAQNFDTDSTLWPLNQPVPKVDALIQCAGETKYTNDLPTRTDEVHAAFVLSTIAVGTILKIDATAALKFPGVLAFYSASDIPGVNSFTPGGSLYFPVNEELLCSGNVKYYNEPIGIIVADSHHTAVRAAKLVKVTYKASNATPVFDIKEAVKDTNRVTLNTAVPSTDKGTDIVKNFKGENVIYGQYHFAMELISCITIPSEEGLEVHTTTQWMDCVQWMISLALNLPAHKIDIYVRRLGGGFGIKVSRTTQIAVACGLVTLKLNRPCRMVLPLTDTMRAVGKRLPCLTQYDCSVNASGVIQYVDYKVYEDNGYSVNEPLSSLGVDIHTNCYKSTRWNYAMYDAITDTAKNSWCRAPGTLETIAMAELLLERISYELSLDPWDVRLANIDSEQYGDIIQMMDTLKLSASYTERRNKVTHFNSENKWTKRGLRVSLSRWRLGGPPMYDINIAVFHTDGTVAITHGGIEMGQGINTKAVQVCAYMLKIPMDKIQIKANSSTAGPNCFPSGGSGTSQGVCIGIKRGCEKLLERLEPIRQQMTNPTWEELIANAYNSSVDLHVHEFVSNTDLVNYDVFGVSIAEVEVDILTGEVEILRVDILQDAGRSVSPELDIGQVEGAFIMGQGYWTTENLKYDSKTGELLTDRTWFYYVPLATDIPQDFRITLKKKSYSFDEILGSKATGEPPICLSVVIALAIREAITASRQDVGIPSTQWFPIDGPCTIETIGLLTKSLQTDYKFN